MATRSRCFTLRLLSIAALLLCCAALVRRAEANTVFDVSGTFDDNSSTPLFGTITLTSTNQVVDFDFNIPTMTLGVTVLPGAIFTPATATFSFDDFGPAAFVDFQLNGAPPEGEELFLLIPEPIAVPYDGGPLLQAVPFSGTTFHTGYQSGPQSNPFIELSSNGTITATPEPSSYVFLVCGVAAILIKRSMMGV